MGSRIGQFAPRAVLVLRVERPAPSMARSRPPPTRTTRGPTDDSPDDCFRSKAAKAVQVAVADTRSVTQARALSRFSGWTSSISAGTPLPSRPLHKYCQGASATSRCCARRARRSPFRLLAAALVLPRGDSDAPQARRLCAVPLITAVSSHRRTTRESQRFADERGRCGDAEGLRPERGDEGWDLGAASAGAERSRDRAPARPAAGEREQPPGANGRHPAQGPPAPGEVLELRRARGDLARDRPRALGARDRPGAWSLAHDDRA